MTSKFQVMVVDDYPDIHDDFIKTLLGKEKADAFDALSSFEAEIFGEPEPEPETMPLIPMDLHHASQGKEAFEKVKTALQEHNPFSLIFMDFRMPPGWNGVETIKHIWELDPEVEMVMCTAYSDSTWEAIHKEFHYTDRLIFLKKPFQSKVVQQLSISLLRKWEMRQSTGTDSKADVQTSLLLANHQPLVVMCMYCQKIKEPAGSWVMDNERVEGKYNVAVTHSMCPSCFDEARSTFEQSMK